MGDTGVACLYFAKVSSRTGELQHLEVQACTLKKFRLVRAEAHEQQEFLTLFNTHSAVFKTRLDVQATGHWALAWNVALDDPGAVR